MVKVNKEGSMQCPFLQGKRLLACRSLGEIYIPSIIELDEYCMGEACTHCPAYCVSPDGTQASPTDEVNASDL